MPLILLLAGSISGCPNDASRELSLTFTYPPGSEPVRLEVKIFGGAQCEGEPIKTFDLNEPIEPALELESGTYCLGGIGYDSTCSPLLKLESVIELPYAEDEREIALAPVDPAPGPACSSEFCDPSIGRCCCSNESDCNQEGRPPCCVAEELPCTDGACSDLTLTGGNGHTCTLVNSEVHCWGDNGLGQTGGPTGASQQPPHDVTQTARHIDAGDLHTCLVTPEGGVMCWGDNTQGQLGSLTAGSTPLTLPTISDATEVEAGSAHSCVIDDNDDAWCWGSNVVGQLGAEDAVEHDGPVQVVIDGKVLRVAAGAAHTCFRYEPSAGTSAVGCVGNNEHGQLGMMTAGQWSESLRQVPLTDPLSVAAGFRHTCAIDLVDGVSAVRCWGDNQYGQLGNGSTEDSTPPVNVTLDSEFNPVQIVAGERFTCIRGGASAGEVYCWGDNEYGQLATNEMGGSSTPQPVGLPSPALAIGAGQHHVCAAVQTGELYCWGRNNHGQTLAPSTLANVTMPHLAVAPNFTDESSTEVCEE